MMKVVWTLTLNVFTIAPSEKRSFNFSPTFRVVERSRRSSMNCLMWIVCRNEWLMLKFSKHVTNSDHIFWHVFVYCYYPLVKEFPGTFFDRPNHYKIEWLQNILFVRSLACDNNYIVTYQRQSSKSNMTPVTVHDQKKRFAVPVRGLRLVLKYCDQEIISQNLGKRWRIWKYFDWERKLEAFSYAPSPHMLFLRLTSGKIRSGVKSSPCAETKSTNVTWSNVFLLWIGFIASFFFASQRSYNAQLHTWDWKALLIEVFDEQLFWCCDFEEKKDLQSSLGSFLCSQTFKFNGKE